MKNGWKEREGIGSKCRVKPPVEVTPEMETRRVETDRTQIGDFDYVTYYDPETEVYWAEKIPRT